MGFTPESIFRMGVYIYLTGKLVPASLSAIANVKYQQSSKYKSQILY